MGKKYTEGKTDEDSSVSLSEVSDDVSGRNKRAANPLLTFQRRTRRNPPQFSTVLCKKGNCNCRGQWCRSKCIIGRPKCVAKSANGSAYCMVFCKNDTCIIFGKCVTCSCSAWGNGKAYCTKC
ncbi:hypothetical protein LSAT2_023926 [Lamellibrachia satsuma]|nr:hypothetical protein LSAT2_023926 [Lamellibrachia satsuma]